MCHRYCLAILTMLAAGPAWAGDLDIALRPLIGSHHGKVAVAVWNLKTGDRFEYRGDEPMPTASLIKLPVMMEAYLQSAEGRLNLEDRITLADADKVPGSGILTSHFTAGATLSLRDAIRLMIVYSDNTATNLVLDKIGIGATAERMEAWGYSNTKIHSKVFRRDTSLYPDRSQQFGLGSTTALEMVAILKELYDGPRFRQSDRAAMLDHLRHCEDADKFKRFLPSRAVIMHKTGAVDRSRTDAGIVETGRGAVAVCVLTTDNEDTTWRADNAGNLLCARIARVVYDHYVAAAAD